MTSIDLHHSAKKLMLWAFSGCFSETIAFIVKIDLPSPLEGEALSFQTDCRKAAWDKDFCRMVTVDAGHYHNFSYRPFFDSYRKLYMKTITDRHHIVGALMNTGISRHGPETIVLKKTAAPSSKRISHLQWKVKDRKPSGPPEHRLVRRIRKAIVSEAGP